MKRVLVAVVLWLALPNPAHAGTGASIAARDLPLGPVRSLAALEPSPRFDLVGLHWQGTGRVEFRTRGVGGRWSAWRLADADGHIAPRGGWTDGEPYWTGSSDRLDYRVSGSILRLRAFYVRSPVELVPYRTESIAGSPRIVPRAGWHADEAIRRAEPRFAPAVRFAIVHHTAGTNAYTPAQSSAIVRAIELYHVKGNGWNDIGYNFLVDRYGQVFEGRFGGVTRAVVGAHAEGFNSGSVGVAVIGNFSAKAPPAAAQQALVDLLAWRLDVAHDDPLATLTWRSGGNPRFRIGRAISLRAISGHRDTGFTDCPGTALYRLLPALAAKVAATGLPKLYAPTVQGALGGPIRFSGRISSALRWTVSITRGGEVIARGSGNGATVSWTWDSRGAAAGRYTWTIEAGPSVRPASGVLGTSTVAPPPPPPPPPAPPPPPPPPPAALLSDLAISPTTLSPNGDGFADGATVTYTLGARAAVTATIVDAGGSTVRTVFAGQTQSARTISFPLSVDDLPDGAYTLDVEAVAADGSGSGAQAGFFVDRTLSGVAVSPSPFTIGSGSLSVSFSLAKPAQVAVAVAQNGQPLATVFSGPLEVGQHAVGWDGQLPEGPAPPGHYDAVVTAVDDVGQSSQAAGFDVVTPGG